MDGDRLRCSSSTGLATGVVSLLSSAWVNRLPPLCVLVVFLLV